MSLLNASSSCKALSIMKRQTKTYGETHLTFRIVKHWCSDPGTFIVALELENFC